MSSSKVEDDDTGTKRTARERARAGKLIILVFKELKSKFILRNTTAN